MRKILRGTSAQERVPAYECGAQSARNLSRSHGSSHARYTRIVISLRFLNQLAFDLARVYGIPDTGSICNASERWSMSIEKMHRPMTHKGCGIATCEINPLRSLRSWSAPRALRYL